jgi:hypothetical protein
MKPMTEEQLSGFVDKTVDKKRSGFMNMTADASGNDNSPNGNPNLPANYIAKAEASKAFYPAPLIYVASRATTQHGAMWRHYRNNIGLPIVSSWIDQTGVGESDYGKLWSDILEEIRHCKALFFYAVPDDFPLKGAFVEVGMALAFNKRVYCILPGVVLEERTLRPVGSWMNHPNVKRLQSVTEAWNEVELFAREGLL